MDEVLTAQLGPCPPDTLIFRAPMEPKIAGWGSRAYRGDPPPNFPLLTMPQPTVGRGMVNGATAEPLENRGCHVEKNRPRVGGMERRDHWLPLIMGAFTIIPDSELVPPTGLNQTNMPGCPQPPKPETWWVAAFCEVQSGVSTEAISSP